MKQKRNLEVNIDISEIDLHKYQLWRPYFTALMSDYIAT